VPVLYRIAEGPGERKRVKEEERLARLRESRERVEAEKRERQREQAVEARHLADRDGSAPCPADGSGRRRSLKERGGLLGIARRRLGRD